MIASPIRLTALLLLVAACDTGSQKTPDAGPRGAADSQATSQSDEFTTAATNIVGFLRGTVPFEQIGLADTVTLHLGIEEGRSRRAIARDVLREPSNWVVRSPSLAMTYSFVPHPRLTVLTTRLGRHLNCGDYPLSATFPDLASLPHVGTTLRPPDFQSCLQTWNLTLVFDGSTRPPVLVAAVYDQPEW